MKEFEKWWEDSGCHVWDIRGCEQAWKVALEWVLSIDSGFCSCGCMNVDTNFSTQEQIEQELKNLNKGN